MAWTGKAVGTAVGSVFGIFGAGVGMWLGHLYDQEQAATTETEQSDFWELRLNFMRALAGIAMVDGPLTSRERRCLDCISADLFPDLNETQLWSVRQTTTNGAFSPQQAAALAMTMHAEGQVGLISQLISIVYTDGEFGPVETRWMQQFTDAAGIPPEKWNWLLVLFDRFATAEDGRRGALQALGLPPEATDAEIKARYRQQAGEYHPDRLGHLSPAIRELAEQKMKEINNAYQILTKANLEPTGPAEPMAALDAHEHRAIAEHRLSKGSVVGCPLCQRINRLPERSKFGSARCGSCFALLILPLPVVQDCLRQQNPNHDYENTEDYPLPCVSDGTLYRVLHKLLLLESERLSYRALDVEQIGSVYQTMIGFTLEIAQGTSIALKPAKSKGAPAFIDLDALLAAESGKRAEHLQKLTDHKLTGNAATALKSAQTQDDLLAALDRKIAKAASPDKVSPGSLILQPTDERRRSGSHYTPRALTAPIVRKTLEPILARLGEHPTPLQILELKVCDPAVGSGAFLVEACRQLGDALVAAWQHHGGKPVIPPDEDELLHARRLVAQRCLYGVDRNPMATDLAKLSLWLSTLAKDHPFTFLDHCLRTGDALVGLSKKQIMAFHWDLTAPAAKDRQFGQQEIEKAVEIATSYRKEILEGGDYMLPGLKAERLKHADHTLDVVRRAGDLCVAAFFDAENPKARTTQRENYLDTLLAADPKRGYNVEKAQEVRHQIERLRGIRTKNNLLPPLSKHSVTPFHWPIEFPEVFGRENGGFDAFIGNPPYGGKNTIADGNHKSYLDWLKTLHEESHGNADLVAHFFRRAFILLRRDGTFGLIATNTIRQGDTRHTGLRWICTNGGTIYAARRRYKWAGAAAVTVSVVWIAKGDFAAPFDLDGQSVNIITAYLFHDGGHDNPATLLANSGKSFIGSYVLGMGFTFDDTDKKGIANTLADKDRIIATNPRNAERIFPYLGGEEVNDSPRHSHHRYVINFSDFPLRRDESLGSWMNAEDNQRATWLRGGCVPADYPGPVAADWPDLLRIVEQKVKPDRLNQGSIVNPDRWYRFARPASDLAIAVRGFSRVIALPRVTEHMGFTFLSSDCVFSEQLVVVASEKMNFIAILQSRLHEVWGRFFSGSLEDRLRYAPSDCFETFPLPVNWESSMTLEAAGLAYYEFRAALMVENNEGLTKTYNRFHDPSEDSPGILRLRELHAAMDHAVLTAYGWNDLIESGRTTCEFIPDYYDEPEQEGGEPVPKSIRYRWPDATRDEVLARLLKLNAERAAQEGQPIKTAAAQKPKPKKASVKAPKTGKAQLALGIGTPSGKERVLPSDFRLTQRFLFNVYELSTDLDVFVTFETMNNRGKPLTRLELLKNRLIYLSTLSKDTEPERQKVRSNINAVWKTIYEELGRQPGSPLGDDEFLRAHWIGYFGYDKDEADPLTQFLLNKHFTAEQMEQGKLTLKELQAYIDSIQISVRCWQWLHFPDKHEDNLGQILSRKLERISRLGFGVLKPLLLASLIQEESEEEKVKVVTEAERFLLLVRSLGGARSHVGEAESYRFANELYIENIKLAQAASMLKDRVTKHFNTQIFQLVIDELFNDAKGFYELPGLHFILFDYEDSLRLEAKAVEPKVVWGEFKGSMKSIEHVYPQDATDSAWPDFSALTEIQKHYACHSLGNLVAVSVAKNASLSRSSFADKVKGTDKIPGFSQGSFSELRIAQSGRWTVEEIRARGLAMLKFIEDRWSVSFGDEATKLRLLRLEAQTQSQ